MISVAVPQRRAKKLGLPMLLGFLALLLQPLGLSAQVPDLGGRLEIFVDRFLIERLRGAELKLHEPESAGVVLRFDRPWEGAFCGYATVIKDGPAYRLYYRGLPTAGQDGSHEEVTCYAESADGIDWKKPNLGLFEVRGTRDNNVILHGYREPEGSVPIINNPPSSITESSIPDSDFLIP